jgi:hypothetical protein
LQTTTYVQTCVDIDDDHLRVLSTYLSYVTKCFGGISTAKEAQRLHLIAPILLCVCHLFKGEVEVVVEEDLNGKIVKAHGHFEFMLRRGNKAVCIVEAKKEDFEQRMAQDLIGCEVAAELGDLDIVYGIVTNYIQWNFLRSLDDAINMQECTLDLTDEGVPELQSLRKITGKIYGMLSGA